MGSIVKAPNNLLMDYDYIAFSFNGKHSYDDFGIYRISDSDTGYNDNLIATKEEKKLEVPGKDEELYAGAQFKNRVFDIKFAFEGLTEEKMLQMKKWLGTKDIHDLWFSETPHKVYSARVTNVATMHTTPTVKNGVRMYTGKGSVQFTCSYPFAHTPRWVKYGNTQLEGKEVTSYWRFPNYSSIEDALPGYKKDGVLGENAMGDQPFTFVAHLGRVGYNRLVVHANNGTSEKETIDWQDLSELNWEDICNSFTSPETGYVISSWNTKADGSGASRTDLTGLTGDTEWYAQWDKTFTISFYKALDIVAKAHCGSDWADDTGIQEDYGCSISYDGGTNYSVIDASNYRGKFTDTGFIKTISGIPRGAKLYIWVRHNSSHRNAPCTIASNITGTLEVKNETSPYHIVTVDKDIHITFEWDLNGILLFKLGSSVWNCYIGEGEPEIEEGGLKEWQTKAT